MKKSFFDKQNRYSIRKLTVGAASVLIGFAFMSNSQSAKAATENDNNTNSGSANTETTNKGADQPGAQSQTGVNYKNANSVAPQANGENTQPLAPEAKTTPAATNVQKPVAPKGSEFKPLNLARVPQAKAANAQNTQTVNDYSQFLSALRDTNVTNIVLGQNIDFSSANLKHGALNLQNGDYEQINNQGIARKLTIDGAGFTLNMGNKYIDFTNANQTATNNWDITLTNFQNIISSSTYGTPFYFDVSAVNGEKDYVTFDNDTINANRVVAAAGTGDNGVNVKFTGDNAINTTFVPVISTAVANNSAFSVNSVEVVSGNTTINAIYTQPYLAYANNQGAVFTITNGSDLKTAQDSNFIVDSGATMTINTNGKDNQGNDSKNIMGISFDGTAKGANIDTAKEGVVRIKDGGNLEMNMTQGASQAIFASHVDVQSNGNLTIDTKQDTTDSTATSNHGNHYAPITLGNTTAAVGDTNDELRVSPNGVLKITRKDVAKSTSPLISYGNSGVSAGKNFKLDVQGTLDLQDSAQDPDTMSGVAQGTDTEPWAGLITMWGTSANDTVEFNNPDYVNLQRTGAQHGSLLRIEGSTNNTYINNGVDATTPLAQWDQGNISDPSFVWYITKEHNQNNWGNNSNTFAKKGEDPKALLAGQTASQQLIDSNQTAVTLAPNQVGGGQNGWTNSNAASGTDGVGYNPNYLNQIGNNFNWWTPQRIAMGSKLSDNGVKISDADEYQPETQTINTDTSHKLSDLTAVDGIKDLLNSAGKTVAKDTKVTDDKGNQVNLITSVEWTKDSNGNYDVKDSTGKAIDASKNFPAAGDYNANATVTYADGSQDTDVIIPIHVTAPTDASTYTPEQKPNSVDKGATSVPAANGVTDYKNDKDGTTTTTFPNDKGVQTAPTVTWDNPKPGQDPKTGIPVGVDTSKPGIYDNIPATVTYPDGSTDKINETVVVGNVVDVTDNNNHNHDNTPDDPNAIPDGYELVNVTITNGHFGSDTSATTPKKYLVKDNTSKDEFVSAVDPKANDGYSQSSEKWAPELPATFGKSDMNKTYNVAFSAATLDKDLYQPSYTGQTMKPSDSKNVPVAYTPSTDGKINVGGKAPAGTKYTVDNTGLPAGMTATVADNGTVTITTNNTPEGAVNIPVTVTYPDGTTDKPDSETVYVPVYVTDNKGDETVTWDDNGAVVTKVDTSKLNAHETSDNSQVLNAASAVTVNGYALGSDGKISTTATPITVDPSKVTWSTTPDTTVPTATAAGKQITNESIKVDLTGNTDAQNILGSKNGVVTTDPFTIDAKGAGAKNVTTPVDVTVGSDLTDDQFKALVDNNIPTNEIASTTWGTKPDKDGRGGVIKITFKDNGANGQPTYLNINIPASSLHMVPATNSNDADKYTPETKPNEVENGATSIPAENGIKDYKDQDGKVVTTMPDKNGNQKAPTVTWDHTDDKGMPIDPATGNPIDTSKSGIYDDVPAKVTYPDGSVDDNVPETVVVGNVIDVTNNIKHNDPTKDPAPDGYIYETFKAENGSFAPLDNTPAARAANPTTKIFLVKSGTAKAEVLAQMNPKADQGYDQKTGTWNPVLPDTFTVDKGVYTITFSNGTTGSTDTDAAQYDVTYKPQIVKGGDSVTVDPVVTKGTDKTPTTVPDGTKYSFDNGKQTTPIDGVTVKIDQTTGKITFTAPTDSSATMKIPVKVTYPDNTADKPSVADTTATVYVVNGYPKDNPAKDPKDPIDAINNTGKNPLPGDTTATWDPAPDNTKKDQDQQTNVTVTIPGVGSVTVPSDVIYPSLSYPDTDVPQGGSKTISPTDKPEGDTYKQGDTKLPDGMTVSVDPKTGDVTVTTTKDTPLGPVTIPVVGTDSKGNEVKGSVTVNVTKPGTKPTTPEQGAIVITYYDKNKGLSETVSQAPDITGSKGQPVSAADLKSAIDNGIPAGWVIDPSFVYPDAMTIPGTVNVPIVRAGDQGQVPPTNGGNQGGDKNPSTGDNQTPTDNGNQNTNNTGDNGMNNSNGNGSNANSGANTGMSNSGNGNSGMMNTSNTMNNGAKTSSKSSANMNMNANSKKLPQTGEAKNNAGIFGLAIASIAGLFGLAGSRKRREDK